MVNINNYVTIALGRGDGTFKTGLLVGTGNAPQSLIADDFNSDGLPDLATADYESRSVSILLNRSSIRRLHTGRTPALPVVVRRQGSLHAD